MKLEKWLNIERNKGIIMKKTSLTCHFASHFMKKIALFD